jgi:hypothetical protein
VAMGFIMECGTIFKTFLSFIWCLYIFSNISMPHMIMEISRMSNQDEVVPSNV